MPSPQNQYGNRNKHSKPQQKASVSSKDLLHLFDSDYKDDTAVKSATRKSAPIRPPACSNVHHPSSARTELPQTPIRESSVASTPAPICPPACSNVRHPSSARTELPQTQFREAPIRPSDSWNVHYQLSARTELPETPFMELAQTSFREPPSASMGRNEPDQTTAPATPREPEMIARMAPVDPQAAAVQQTQTERPLNELIWWMLTRLNVPIGIMRSAGAWLLLNPIKTVKLVFSWAMILAISWTFFLLYNTAKGTLEPLFGALLWFKGISAWGSTLATSATTAAAKASQGIVGGLVHHQSSWALLQEPGLVLPRIDTSFQVTVGHVNGLLAAAMSPREMVGFTSQLIPMTESWAKAMRDWELLRPDWMQSVVSFLGYSINHAHTLAILDQKWAHQEKERAAEAARLKDLSWLWQLGRSLTRWLGREHDTPVTTEGKKTESTLMHAREIHGTVEAQIRSSKRYVESFSGLQERLSSTVEPACITSWLQKSPSQSVRIINGAASESEMAEENMYDAKMSLKTLCTVVKEATTELEKVKDQLEKDQFLLLRQAEILSEQVNALARTSQTSETEMRVLRGKVIDTVKKVAETLTEHFEDAYYS